MIIKFFAIKTVQLVTFIVKDYVTYEFTCINACPLPDLKGLVHDYAHAPFVSSE